MNRSLKSFVSCSLFLLILSSGVFPSDVFASSSSSYQLHGAPQSIESSQSSSYQLCSRVGSVPTAGTSASYMLSVPLNCSVISIVPVGSSGGGRRRDVCGDFFVRDG